MASTLLSHPQLGPPEEERVWGERARPPNPGASTPRLTPPPAPTRCLHGLVGTSTTDSPSWARGYSALMGSAGVGGNAWTKAHWQGGGTRGWPPHVWPRPRCPQLQTNPFWGRRSCCARPCRDHPPPHTHTHTPHLYLSALFYS